MDFGENSPFDLYDRAAWAQRCDNDSVPLSNTQIKHLAGLEDPTTLDEVADVYMPLTRLLDIHIDYARKLHQSMSGFTNRHSAKMPFIIGIAGSVSVGKSTVARLLHYLFSQKYAPERVNLVTTDGFLYPNAILEDKGLMDKKGFPQSYNRQLFLSFLSDLKAGKSDLSVPVYSHLAYDIVPGEKIHINQPEIVIVEGLNILQPSPPAADGIPKIMASDFLDFSIYVDADQDYLQNWYVKRLKTLRRTAFVDPKSYFHKYALMKDAEIEDFAVKIWRSINLLNLEQNILPTRPRADLILEKGCNHAIKFIALRKI